MKKYYFSAILSFFLLSFQAWSSTSPLDPAKRDSPRDTMRTYLEAMNDYKKGLETGNEDLIARLDVAARSFHVENLPFVIREERAREAAILIKEVIDRVILIDFSKIPHVSEDGKDKETGKLLLRWRLKGTEITIARVPEGNRAGEYLFTEETVQRATSFYKTVKKLPYLEGSGGGAAYREPWIERHLPQWARQKFFLMPTWKWLGILVLILAGILIKSLAQVLFMVVERFTHRSQTDWDDRVAESLKRPFGLVVASGFWYASIHFLSLNDKAAVFLTAITQIIFTVAVIWAIYGLSEVLMDFITQLFKKTEFPLDDQLIRLSNRALKIFIIFFGVLIVIQNLGFNVMSVFAGLGLGGLAFALAAKDTCANLFGSIMILIDRPFSVGDWIVVNNIEGTVEDIGFRSTRIRTFYKSVAAIPNSIIANANIDNLGRRSYRRIKTTLGLTYDTPPEKIEAFVEGLKRIIQANRYTRKDDFHVVFSGYGASSLDVLIYCFLDVPDWSTELVERQNLYLEVLRLAHELEVDFAFPTQTLHVDSLPGQEPPSKNQDVDSAHLISTASSFGPNGSKAKPQGLGIFTPTYEEAKNQRD